VLTVPTVSKTGPDVTLHGSTRLPLEGISCSASREPVSEHCSVAGEDTHLHKRINIVALGQSPAPRWGATTRPHLLQSKGEHSPRHMTAKPGLLSCEGAPQDPVLICHRFRIHLTTVAPLETLERAGSKCIRVCLTSISGLKFTIQRPKHACMA